MLCDWLVVAIKIVARSLRYLKS